SLTLISEPQKYTVSRALLSFWGEFVAQLGPQYAYIVLSAMPTIVIYVIFHKQIQSGVMIGAVKG
ncbi:MAG: carbohydrate ABC transporter permease, partial [Eubacteriales bacterium]|nr:carbohydrate ABC transporter permease [Eubacteriales bacterium]